MSPNRKSGHQVGASNSVRNEDLLGLSLRDVYEAGRRIQDRARDGKTPAPRARPPNVHINDVVAELLVDLETQPTDEDLETFVWAVAAALKIPFEGLRPRRRSQRSSSLDLQSIRSITEDRISRKIEDSGSPPEPYDNVESPWLQSIGPVYLADEVYSVLGGVSPEELPAKALLALQTIDEYTVYPAFQFSGGQVLTGLLDVLNNFPRDDPDLLWTVASWLRKPLTSLGDRSVVEVLLDGETEAAVRVARATAMRWSR